MQHDKNWPEIWELRLHAAGMIECAQDHLARCSAASLEREVRGRETGPARAWAIEKLADATRRVGWADRSIARLSLPRLGPERAIWLRFDATIYLREAGEIARQVVDQIDVTAAPEWELRQVVVPPRPPVGRFLLGWDTGGGGETPSP